MKYDLPLFKERPKVWRKINVDDGCCYLIPTDVLNIADHVHFDPNDPESQGYGGSTLEFTLEDGTVHKAKGPWHGGGMGLLKEVGLDIRDLHATQVTLYAVEYEERTFKAYERNEDGKLVYRDVTRLIPVRGKVLYREEQPVLGMFMRGDRIAHAYANATGKPVFVDRESFGGGSKHMVSPGDEMHPMAANYE